MPRHHVPQVLPYIYTHLVSISCTIFLVGNAFLKGLYFEPDASLTFGLALPLASIVRPKPAPMRSTRACACTVVVTTLIGYPAR